MKKSVDTPFETTLMVRDTCLCLHTQRAARAIARRFDTALKPVGISSGQFSLLMSLNRPEPAKLAQVALLLGVDRTTLTANLKPMLRDRLVSAAPDPKDARARLLTLTPAGHRLLAKAVPIWRRVHAEIEGVLSAPDKMRADLDRLAGWK